MPAPGTFGNLGRNTVVGPGFADVDLSLEKDFPVRREGARVRFRAEMFDVLNHANFGLPSPIALVPAGTGTGACGCVSKSAGRITSTVNPLAGSRQIQLSLKFIF